MDRRQDRRFGKTNEGREDASTAAAYPNSEWRVATGSKPAFGAGHAAAKIDNCAPGAVFNRRLMDV